MDWKLPTGQPSLALTISLSHGSSLLAPCCGQGCRSTIDVIASDNAHGFQLHEHCVEYKKLWPAERRILNMIRPLLHRRIYAAKAAVQLPAGEHHVVFVHQFGERGPLFPPESSAKLLESHKSTHAFYKKLQVSRAVSRLSAASSRHMHRVSTPSCIDP